MISENDFEGKKFPYTESNKLEFKESFVDKGFDKYLQTICGFLNSGGGNLIFGIKDNLDLIGLNSNNNKCIDKIILRIDSIISEKQIVGLNSQSNEYVSIDSADIKTKQIVNKSNKKFIIVEILPKQDTKYQLAGGMIFYRLGASNYFEKTERIYKQSDFESACKNIQQKAEQDNKLNIELFNKVIGEKDTQIEVLNKKIEEIENTNVINQEYIKNIITQTNNINSKQPIYIGQNTNSINEQADIENQKTQQTDYEKITSGQTQIIYYDYNKLLTEIIKKIFPCFN